jgi:hypothetical protein
VIKLISSYKPNGEQQSTPLCASKKCDKDADIDAEDDDDGKVESYACVTYLVDAQFHVCAKRTAE